MTLGIEAFPESIPCSRKIGLPSPMIKGGGSAKTSNNIKF